MVFTTPAAAAPAGRKVRTFDPLSAPPPTPSSARVDRVTRLQPEGYQWLRLASIDWTDPLGKRRVWEMAERAHCGGDDSEVDGVAVLCLVRGGIGIASGGGSGRGGDDPDVVFVSQYRPPVASVCVELPAGLVDRGEDAVAAGLRELEEETGYVADREDVRYVSGPCPLDPGMSNSDMRWVVVEVDGDDPRHGDPRTMEGEGEFVQVHRVPLGGGDVVAGGAREGGVGDRLEALRAHDRRGPRSTRP